MNLPIIKSTPIFINHEYNEAPVLFSLSDYKSCPKYLIKIIIIEKGINFKIIYIFLHCFNDWEDEDY